MLACVAVKIIFCTWLFNGQWLTLKLLFMEWIVDLSGIGYGLFQGLDSVIFRKGLLDQDGNCIGFFRAAVSQVSNR